MRIGRYQISLSPVEHVVVGLSGISLSFVVFGKALQILSQMQSNVERAGRILSGSKAFFIAGHSGFAMTLLCIGILSIFKVLHRIPQVQSLSLEDGELSEYGEEEVPFTHYPAEGDSKRF